MSGTVFTAGMADDRRISERQRSAMVAVGQAIRHAREDEGISIRTLGRAAGVDPSHLARAEAGRHTLSQDALVAVATVLGRDVSWRLFEAGAPLVRDRVALPMFDALFSILHGRWRPPRLEVNVTRPARGVIDAVLQDRLTSDTIATEGHSLLHSVEGQVRWAGAKADSLPSARGWPWTDRTAEPRISRLLLLRSCEAMHRLVVAYPSLFAAAYPAPPEQAHAALTGGMEPWPGAAILWVTVEGGRGRVLDGAPRAVKRSGWPSR
jgi:transcriptional regulator with XRE-family HTH domain